MLNSLLPVKIHFCFYLLIAYIITIYSLTQFRVVLSSEDVDVLNCCVPITIDYLIEKKSK